MRALSKPIVVLLDEGKDYAFLGRGLHAVADTEAFAAEVTDTVNRLAPASQMGRRNLTGVPVTGVHGGRCLGMTDFMVKIPADWLARVFLSLRHCASQEAQSAASELQPFTEKPGQRVPVPRATVMRSELALRVELESVEDLERRARLSQEAEQLINARLGSLGCH